MLAQVIRDCRNQLGFSQVKLSHLSGVSLPTIQNIEAGVANPSFDTLQALCRALYLDISISEKKANLDLLVAAGLPINDFSHSAKSKVPLPHELVSELTALSLEIAKNQKCDERVIEATKAFLLSIHNHFPKWYEMNLSRIPAIKKLLPIKVDGRLIKLSRLAHDKLSRVL